MKVEITTMSPKGQVVIPQGIRQGLKIKAGDKFAVYGDRDTIIFKRVRMPPIEEFRRLCERGGRFAEEHGITPEDVMEDD